MKVCLVTVLSLCMTGPLAAQVTYNLNFNGAQESPGPGDPTGIGSGTLTLWPDDPASPIYGTVSWNFNYSNLSAPDTLTAMHIHTGDVGVGGGVFLDMGVLTTGGPGTLIQNWTDANWGTASIGFKTWSIAQLEAVLNNPTGYYVNLHTQAFPNGAIRSQIPEPASLVLLSAGGLALLARRRAA